MKFEGERANTVFAKNLFLHNKKNKENLYLIVAAHDTKVDMKVLEKHFSTGSGNLRGADKEVLE